jgi:hypothetical protein
MVFVNYKSPTKNGCFLDFDSLHWFNRPKFVTSNQQMDVFLPHAAISSDSDAKTHPF